MNLEFILIDRPNLVERPTRNNLSSRPTTSVVLVAMFGCALSSSSFSLLEASNSSDFSLSSSCTPSITTSFSLTTAVDTSVGTIHGIEYSFSCFSYLTYLSLVKVVSKCPCLSDCFTLKIICNYISSELSFQNSLHPDFRRKLKSIHSRQMEVKKLYITQNTQLNFRDCIVIGRCNM